MISAAGAPAKVITRGPAVRPAHQPLGPGATRKPPGVAHTRETHGAHVRAGQSRAEGEVPHKALPLEGRLLRLRACGGPVTPALGPTRTLGGGTLPPLP